MSLVEHKKIGVNVKLWNSIAVIAGVFAFLICFLVIANYIQINRLDPVNTEAINTLVKRLSENPNDEALRNEIRALDLLVRKAYFTNQWQVRAGGYILLFSIAVMLIAIQIVRTTTPINPIIDESVTENDQLFKKLSRKWISIGGGAIVVIALILAFLTHDKLEKTFKEAAIIASTNEPEHTEETPNRKVNTTLVEEKTNEGEVVNQASDVQPNDKSEVENVAVTETPSAKTNIPIEAASIPDFVLEARKNFPSFRGANGLGIAYQKNIPTNWDGPSNQNILWKTKTNLKGYNSPIIWGDKLFLTGANKQTREVYCYNKNTGALLWTKIVDKIPGSPGTGPDVTEDTGQAAPTATADGKNVYAIFANGDIIAIDFSGKQVWAKNLGVPQNHYGHSSSLLVYGDKVIVQYDQGKSPRVMALSTQTGAELWSTTRQVKISWASPVIINRGNQAEVVLIADPSIAGYDIQTGKELWKIDCIYGEVGPSVAYSDGIVFGLNEYASLVAIGGGNDPKVIWEDFDYLSDVPSPVATKDLLFVVTSYGVVVCHNAKTGEKYWEHEFDNGFYASPIIVEDKIYLIDRDGIMRIYKASKEFELIGEPALGESVVSSPAFADGQIFVRTEDHLFCISKGN
ncbi:MAG: PQQ-binding-like beta-propeller repeat protein [Bacteroidetes bacterium]|nr:PQQ-binding-like beta-propeller repeat protein [Bacteroidota bacterium]